MKELTVRLTFIENILGSLPADEEIYRRYIASKAPDAKTTEEEVADLGVDAVVEKSLTAFPRMEDGTPFLYDYQVRGFFKDTCSALKKVTGSESSRIKAFKKEIDGLIFVAERKIPYIFEGDIQYCQRPLRAQTMQGERVALAISEEIPAGATVIFTIQMLCDSHEKAVREWLNYGKFKGLGQWRNSGKGRFVWDELDEDGNVIGGNNPKSEKTAA